MDPTRWRKYYQSCQPHIPRSTQRWVLTEDGNFEPAHPVHLLPNGLLDVNNIPPRAVNAITHNNTACRLLMLPSELRRKIYSYTLTPDLKVILRESDDPPPGHPLSRRTMRTVMQDHDGISLLRPHALNEYIHLPRVCRRMYADTALLLYTDAGFEYNLEGPDCVLGLHTWLSQRNQAQRDSILYFSIYVTERDAYSSSTWDSAMFVRSPRIVDVLPRLKRLDVKVGLRDGSFGNFVEKIEKKERREGVEVDIMDMYWVRIFGLN